MIFRYYPWKTYDWQVFGASYPRPNVANSIGPKTDLNSKWDYYYTCDSNPFDCHDEIPQRREPFCFAIAKLLQNATQGGTIDQIKSCVNVDIENHGVLLEPLTNSVSQSISNSSTHDLILDNTDRTFVFNDQGELGSQENITIPLAVEADTDAIITLQTYPRLTDLSLRNPSDLEVLANGITATTSIITDTTYGSYYQYKVNNPISGTWVLDFTSILTDSTVYVISVVVSDSIELDTWLDQDTVSPSSNVVITSHLTGTNQAVSMTVTVIDPDGLTQTLSLQDNGQNGDSIANDGFYGGQFTVGTTTGYYDVLTEASVGEVLRINNIGLAVVSKTALISTVVGEETPDDDGDGLYDNLIANMRFFPLSTGHYAIQADLISPEGLVTQANFSTRVNLSSTLPALNIYIVPLTFSGEAIFASGHNGPYTVTNVIAIDENGYGFVVDEEINMWTTGAYTAEQFDGTRKIDLNSVDYQTPDDDNNMLYDAIQFTLNADSDFTGEFRISGRLVDEMGQTIDWAENQFTISNTGKISPTLEFTGTAISTHQEHGEYTLQDVSIVSTSGGDQWHQYKITTTVPYSYTQFEGLQALSVPELQIALNGSQVTIDWADMGISYEVWLNEEAYPVTNGDCLSLSHCTVQAVNQLVIDLENLPTGLQTVVIVGTQNAVRTQESDPLGIFTVPLETGD